MKCFMAFALLLGSMSAHTQAASPTVETADANWDQLPKLKQRSNDHLSNVAISRIHEIAEERKCQIPGASMRGLTQFEMPFAAQFQPDGTLTRVLLPRLGCPEAEGILGGILLKMIQGGDYRPTGKNEDGWYRGELNFTIGG
jgi:hypothetical protein